MPIINHQQKIDNEVIDIKIEVDKVPEKSNDYYQNLRKNLRGSKDKVINIAKDLFGDGLQLAHNCALQVVNRIKDMNEFVRPDEFSLQLAIKLDSEVGAVLAKMGTEAQMLVSMKWARKEGA
ncbi:MAG: CU044_2847 family protein [Candidatus Hodarchaeota archaeon]